MSSLPAPTITANLATDEFVASVDVPEGYTFLRYVDQNGQPITFPIPGSNRVTTTVQWVSTTGVFSAPARIPRQDYVINFAGFWDPNINESGEGWFVGNFSSTYSFDLSYVSMNINGDSEPYSDGQWSWDTSGWSPGTYSPDVSWPGVVNVTANIGAFVVGQDMPSIQLVPGSGFRSTEGTSSQVTIANASELIGKYTIVDQEKNVLTPDEDGIVVSPINITSLGLKWTTYSVPVTLQFKPSPTVQFVSGLLEVTTDDTDHFSHFIDQDGTGLTVPLANAEGITSIRSVTRQGIVSLPTAVPEIKPVELDNNASFVINFGALCFKGMFSMSERQ